MKRMKSLGLFICTATFCFYTLCQMPQASVDNRINSDRALSFDNHATGSRNEKTITKKITDTLITAGIFVAIVALGSFCLYVLAQDPPKHIVDSGPVTVTGAPITSVAFSPDSKYLACASGKAVCILDTRSGSRYDRFHYSAPVTSVAFSPDGKYLASAIGKTIKIVNAQTGNWSHDFHVY